MGAALNRGLTVALITSGAVTLLLYVVPYGDLVGLPLVWMSTLAHELGHGLTAVLFGGHFSRLELFSDASGVAWTRVDGRLARAAVAAGGLLGPSLVAALAFLAARTARGARLALLAAGLFLVATTLLWVRTPFGIAFVLGLAVILLGVGWRFGGQVPRFVAAFLGVQLSLSVFSRGDYLFTPTAHTAGGTMPSDVAQIADALFLPYWVWGGVCGLVSLGVLAGGLWLALWRPRPSRWGAVAAAEAEAA